MPEGLLSGIKVVEVSSWIAAPAATLLLAEAGADVVKVEPPGGDPARDVSGFATWNRSKRSVVLDLHTDDGRASLQELLAGADILVHGLRPSVARRAGIHDDQLTADHPGLIWCGITGWPHGHPDEDRPAYEVLTHAAVGVLDEELGTREGPVYLRFPFGSWNAAFLGVIGLLARLRVRDATGQGGPVHTSLFQGALAPMSKHWGRSVSPTEMMSFPNLFKGMNMVQYCSDGEGIVTSMAEVALSDTPLYKEVLAELPRELAEDPLAAGAEVVKRRTRAQWLEAAWAMDVPTVPTARRLGESLSEEQTLVNDYAIEVDDPVWGKTVQAGHPFHVDPPLAVQRPAPRLGEHTEEVLGTGKWPARPAPQAKTSAKPKTPLEGLKVLDFGMFLAGPYGPQLMADLGAEVVKVEATTGDRLRGSERIFAGCQRGKRSIAVDLRAPESKIVLKKLIEWADVIHHNLRMPPAVKLGLGYEDVRKIKPEVIYCHVSSYGPQGPRKDWPGIDPTSQAVVGWMHEGAGEGNPPRWYRIGMTDDQCAMNSVIAVQLALRHRDKTGEGADVRASILGTAVLTASETMLLPDGSIAPYPHMDHDQTGIGPGNRIYECTDGWVAVAAIGEDALANLQKAAGTTDSHDLPGAFRDRSVAEMAVALGAADVPAEPVIMNHEQGFFDSELYRRIGLSVNYEHPVYGNLEQIGGVFGFGDLDLRMERPPPILGQHTVEVLNEIGVPGATVAELTAAGLLAGPGLPE